MRWFLIDRFTELISGKCATAVKAVSLAEEPFIDHFPGCALLPNTLVIEGMAQTGGLLVSEYNDFEERVVLAKVSRSTFHFCVPPGETITYRATIQQIRKDGAMVSATSHVAERLQGQAEIFFAHLSAERDKRTLFDPPDFYIWLNLLGIFQVGQKPDGTPIPVPPRLARAAQDLVGASAERAPYPSKP